MASRGEPLGSASIICSDKPGTLTQNRMTLVKVYTDTDSVTQGVKNNSIPLNSLLLMATVLFTPLSALFGLIALPAYLYAIGVGLAFVPLPALEIGKIIINAKERKNEN